ncbi:MAG: right-handed parallel beta-helix repeat-containing protein [Planctomycetes bacterium]|nr:right-handed parallel beta-helix repeat-containing protein [Planctomycetota bacterium]
MQHTYPRKAALAVALLLTASLYAGDVNPPPGPVGPTGRFGPRTEVNSTNTPGDGNSLFKITISGSYYLGSNINGEAGKRGIEIAADDVSLDLNGFSLIGIVGSGNGIHAVGRDNLSIHNGTVRDWDGWGVAAYDTANSRFENLRLSSNGTTTAHDGLKVGAGNLIESCISEGNTGHGFDTVFNCVVNNCTARSNGADGINVNDSVVSGCTVSANANHGIHADNGGSTVVNCTANDNGGDGIHAVDASNVASCTVRSNGGAGIRACNSLIRHNTSGGNTGPAVDGCGSSTVIDNHWY